MSYRVAFLLGAGASKPAGFPLLADLTKQVEHRLSGRLQELYLRLRTKPTAGSDDANIERILATLESMRLARICPEGFSLRDVAQLEQDARKQIWEILQKSPQTDYLDRFSSLISEFRPIDIFSLNNDLVLEEWSAQRGIRLTRGFTDSHTWDPASFDDCSMDVKLFKLHGSVDWSHKSGWPVTEVNPRGIIRKPDGTTVGRTLLPELSLVFPSQNKIITESFLLNLHWRFRTTLRQIDLLVVVGCSLGDQHIVGAILDALAEARDLRVLIVDPSIGALGRLITHKGPPISDRVEFLPVPFDETLNGSLLSAMRAALSQKTSLCRRFYQALRQPSPDAFDALADVVASFAALSTVDKQAVDAVLAAFLPKQSISGEFFSFVNDLRDAVASTEPQKLPRTLRAYRGFGAVSRGVAAGVDAVDGKVYFIGSGGQVRRLDAAGNETAIGTSIRDPFGLAVIGRFVYVVDRNALPRYPVEGIGALRRIALDDGKQKRLLRPASSRVRWAELRQLLATAREVVTGSSPNRKLLRQMADRVGMLNYPTAVRHCPPHGLVLVESRRATIIEINGWTPLMTTPGDFLNLSDCAIIDESRILLLEGGAFGEGRIVLWDLQRRSVETFLDDLAGIQGIAIHPSLSYLLLAYGAAIPDGIVERRNLTGGAALKAGPGRPVISGLHRPKYLAHVCEDEWVLSCDTGVLHFNC